MKCTNQPVWRVVLNNNETLLCGRCMSQLAINKNNVSIPTEDTVFNAHCECPGCGKH